MSRATSIECYRQIEREGLLSKARFEIYRALFKRGPSTAGELFNYMGTGLVKGSVCSRLTEMRARGVVIEAGIKTCSFTGKKAIVWDISGRLPKAVKRSKKCQERP